VSVRRGAWLLACLIAGSACNEWVPLAPEPESYPLDSALRICRSWAERGGERGPVFPGREPKVDPSTYNRVFKECMRAHGWVLRRKRHETGPDEPVTGGPVPAPPPAGGA
jgi:hypothetical protein